MSLTCVHFSPELLDLVPRDIAEQFVLMPVYLRKGRPKRKPPIPHVLYVAMADPGDAEAIEACTFCCGLQVKALRGDRSELLEAIPVVYEGGVFARSSGQLSQVAKPAPAVEVGDYAELPDDLHDDLAALEGSLPGTPSTPQHNKSVRTQPLADDELPDDLRNGPPAPEASGPVEKVDPRATCAPISEVARVGQPEPIEPVVPKAPKAPSLPASQASWPPQSKAPLIIVLSHDSSLIDTCNEAVAPFHGRVESANLAKARELAAQDHPSLLIVPEEVYPFDRRAFNLLALELHAPLVIWSDELDPSDMQAMLFSAVHRR